MKGETLIYELNHCFVCSEKLQHELYFLHLRETLKINIIEHSMKYNIFDIMQFTKFKADTTVCSDNVTAEQA